MPKKKIIIASYEQCLPRHRWWAVCRPGELALVVVGALLCAFNFAPAQRNHLWGWGPRIAIDAGVSWRPCGVFRRLAISLCWEKPVALLATSNGRTSVVCQMQSMLFLLVMESWWGYREDGPYAENAKRSTVPKGFQARTWPHNLPKLAVMQPPLFVVLF